MALRLTTFEVDLVNFLGGIYLKTAPVNAKNLKTKFICPHGFKALRIVFVDLGMIHVQNRSRIGVSGALHLLPRCMERRSRLERSKSPAALFRTF